MTIAAFIIGLVIGMFLGFGLCAILVAAGSADRDAEYLYEMRLREERPGRENPLIEVEAGEREGDGR